MAVNPKVEAGHLLALHVMANAGSTTPAESPSKLEQAEAAPIAAHKRTWRAIVYGALVSALTPRKSTAARG